jgi:peptidoglycan/LPS O-acetylase OafA/YrhL
VANRKGQDKRTVLIAAIVIAVLMGGLLAFAQIKTPEKWNLLPAFSGLLIAIVLGLMGLQSELPRYYIRAVISLILGCIFVSINLSNDLATAIYCGAMGVVLLISGATILRRYLRNNPAQTDVINDR